MNNPERAFFDIPRREPGYREVGERLADWHAEELPCDPGILSGQASRCMDCGIPFCHGQGCPLGNQIPELNDLARRGRWRAAWELLSSTDPLAEFTALLCPALCEGACVAGLDGEPVTIRQIERLIVEQAFALGLIAPDPPGKLRKTNIAIAGSGPAGLAAAWRLNRGGWRVTVFERAMKPGGILRYGIPDFKLEKHILERRIEIMRNEGITFETGVDVGTDVSPRYMRDRFAAIVLTGGARLPRDLSVPGRELAGVHFAMPYLTQQNKRIGNETVADKDAISARGLNVVVIGGGDTGSDCVGTALRQGARHVSQFEIMPQPPLQRAKDNPWPRHPNVLKDKLVHPERIKRRWCVMTRRLEGHDGRVKRLHANEVEWVTEEASGRLLPSEIAGTEFTVEADLVLLAMGFTGHGANRLADALGLEKDSRGFICRDANRMTSEPGVFIAGDMAMGASLIVKALADGAEVARNVEMYLSGKTD